MVRHTVETGNHIEGPVPAASQHQCSTSTAAGAHDLLLDPVDWRRNLNAAAAHAISTP
jgi:hypothetical protein